MNSPQTRRRHARRSSRLREAACVLLPLAILASVVGPADPASAEVPRCTLLGHDPDRPIENVQGVFLTMPFKLQTVASATAMEGQILVTIDWGDGTVDKIPVTAGEQIEILLEHTYTRAAMGGADYAIVIHHDQGVIVHAQTGTTENCSGSRVWEVPIEAIRDVDGLEADPPDEVDEVIVPAVVGLPGKEAPSVVTSAGLRPSEGPPVEVPTLEDLCRVVAQQPAAGTSVAEGSPVIFTVGRSLTESAEEARRARIAALTDVNPERIAWSALQQGSRNFLYDFVAKQAGSRVKKEFGLTNRQYSELLDRLATTIDAPGAGGLAQDRLLFPQDLFSAEQADGTLRRLQRVARTTAFAFRLLNVWSKVKAPLDLKNDLDEAAEEAQRWLDIQMAAAERLFELDIEAASRCG